MACGPATCLQQMRDLDGCSAAQPEIKQESTDHPSGVMEAQSLHKSCPRPPKLNMAALRERLLAPHSAKKVTQRPLFTTGRNAVKEIENRAAARKTLTVLPKYGQSSSRRSSLTYKTTFIRPQSQANKSRPSVLQSNLPVKRRDTMYQRKTQGPVIPGPIKNTRNDSGRNIKKEDSNMPSFNSQNQSAAGSSRQIEIGGKVRRQIRHIANLENSVSLLNVDEIEEKLLKESSILKSQILRKVHKNTEYFCEVKKDQVLLDEKISINEMFKSMEEKQDKILKDLELLNIHIKNQEEIIKNQEEIIKNQNEKQDTILKEVTNLKKFIENLSSNYNSEHKAMPPICDDQSPERCIERNKCVPDSENKSHSLRRSLRLTNKGAQYNYDSLRKSTKLLSTPVHSSAAKANTPGRLKRKVIAQLNELYN